MRSKGFVTACFVAGLSVLTSMSAFAGQWKQDSNGWWWQNDDGSYLQNGWYEIDGKQYYFQPDGYVNWDTMMPEKQENTSTQVKQEIVKQFVDVSKYFNTDLQDYEKAKVILNVQPFSPFNSMFYISTSNDDKTINQIACHVSSSDSEESQVVREMKSSFRINYDATTNQICSISGYAPIFISGIPVDKLSDRLLSGSELKTIVEEIGASDITYQHEKRTVPVATLNGSIFGVPLEETLHTERLTFTWNNLKYSYLSAEGTITENNYKFVISRN